MDEARNARTELSFSTLRQVKPAGIVEFTATAIEQIVGRILRLPRARRKQHPDLGCVYVLSVSPSITDVLAELRDALVNNGFTSAESERIILPSRRESCRWVYSRRP